MVELAKVQIASDTIPVAQQSGAWFSLTSGVLGPRDGLGSGRGRSNYVRARKSTTEKTAFLSE